MGVVSLFAISCLTHAADRTLIIDVNIVSPENLGHVEKGSVLIEDGKIIKVERGVTGKHPAGAKVVSGHGQFLIPGLIDSHVHLASVPGGADSLPSVPASLIDAYFKQLPRSYLYYGYTTVIDLAVYDHKRLDEFRHAPLHPDQYDCGEPLPVANGYPMSFAPPQTRFKVFPNFIVNPEQASQIPADLRPEDHTPAAAVARDKASGAVCVKTYFERGFAQDRNLPVPSRETYAGIRRVATEAGLVLMTHANSYEAQKFAVDGGTDVLAHGMWNWGEFENRQALPDEIKVLLDRIVQQKIGYQPTFQVLQGLRAYYDPEYLKIPAIHKIVPGALLEWFNSPEGRWFKKEIANDDVPDNVMLAKLLQAQLRQARMVAGYLAAKDANFLFGTDTPSSPTYGNLPGLNAYLEMQQLQEAGLSLSQIFQAATLSNAKQFKLDQQLGSIEPGKIANLVLLKKSPLESLDAYDSIVSVWIHGQQVRREALSAETIK
jgi:imidazolonepropionase-like amidohydrolase